MLCLDSARSCHFRSLVATGMPRILRGVDSETPEVRFSDTLLLFFSSEAESMGMLLVILHQMSVKNNE